MNLNVKTKDIEVSPDIQEYAETKLKVLLKLLPEEGANALCDLELARTSKHHQSGDVCYAEANISVDGKLYRATAEGATLHEAIDTLQEELKRELRRDKKKENRFMREGGAKVKAILKGFNVGKIKTFRGFGRRRS